MSDVIVIGVAGGTGSGKTTLVKALMNRFGDNISVLSHDNYYKRHDEMSYEERTHLNYDCPDAFDTDMMIEHPHPQPRRRGAARRAAQGHCRRGHHDFRRQDAVR